MKITILGAGVVGVTAAYVLASRGHEVEVIERCDTPAAETSHANGGQLSFSHAEPWANPHVLSKVFGWMFRDDAPLVLRPRLDPHMMAWGLRFLRNCLKTRCDANSVSLLRLGIYSKQMMEKLRVTSGVEFDNLRSGILHIYTGEADFIHAREQAEYQNKFSGTDYSMEVLNREACLRKEPVLERSERDIVGGVFCAIDESGDCGTFTENLATIAAKEMGVQFSYGTEVTRINTSKGKITSVMTNHGLKKADAFVMSMGSYSYGHLRKLGIRVPIYPMKGYSITMPVGDYAPGLSITDNENKVVMTRLGDRLRAAGTAEFAGYNTDVIDHRVAPIIRATRSLFPDVDYSEENMFKWACLRPSTPDGPPIIGRCKYDNLFLNTGHGTLGWTQAAGSAALLADVMENRDTEIALTGFTVDRF
jgi:D-amino-acid dehydrogenase